MKKLNKIAYEVANLQAPMGVIVNYLECIQFQVVKAKNNGDTALIFHSLVNLHGLANAMETLQMLSNRVEELSSLILDYSDEEGAINEPA